MNQSIQDILRSGRYAEVLSVDIPVNVNTTSHFNEFFGVTLDQSRYVDNRVNISGEYICLDPSSDTPVVVGLEFPGNPAIGYVTIYPGGFIRQPYLSVRIVGALVSGNVRLLYGRGEFDYRPLAAFKKTVNTILQMGTVTPGPTWVSGTFNGMAPSSSATVTFDMGAEYGEISIATIILRSIGPSSGLNSVQFYGSDLPIIDLSRRLNAAYSPSLGTIFNNVTTVQGSQSVAVRPFGRYVHITATNADSVNAQGASVVYVSLNRA